MAENLREVNTRLSATSAPNVCAKPKMAGAESVPASSKLVAKLLGEIKPKSELFSKMLEAAKVHFKDNPYTNIWAGIDKEAIIHNARVLKGIDPSKKLCAVLKADAYGHGIDLVAPALMSEVDSFGITDNTEAKAIRALDPLSQKQLMRVRLADPLEIAAALSEGLKIEEMVGTLDQAERISQLTLESHSPSPTPIHVSLNSAGMGRDGFSTEPAHWYETKAALQAIALLPGVKVVGISAHLPVSDLPNYGLTQAASQAFSEQVQELKKVFSNAVDIHLFASAGTLRSEAIPKEIRDQITLNRAGGALFGHQSYEHEDVSKLRHAMNVCTFVTGIFDRDAGNTVGYGSHYRIQQPNGEQHAHIPGGWTTFPREVLLAQPQLKGESRLVVINEAGGSHTILGNPSMNSVICRAVDQTQQHRLKANEPVFLLASQHHKLGGAEIDQSVQDANTLANILKCTGARITVHVGTAKNIAKMLMDQ